MWNDLNVARWSSTKQTLHLVAQMLGKIRLALSPPQPNWMFTPLYLNARGLTTGPVPCQDASLETAIDVFDSQVVLSKSDGGRRTIALLPARSMADIYAEMTAALEALDVPCFISAIPQEIPDTTPLDADRRVRAYDAGAAQRWLATSTTVAGSFERWRSHFFGRSGIQLWWGAFDLALILFNGQRVEAPNDRGYIMKYDLDAALMNAGLYLGDEQNAPFFYGYIYPEPPGSERARIAPDGAAWSAQLHEWILPYDLVRNATHPDALLTAFLDAIYAQCFDLAGWDRDALSYQMPPVKRVSRGVT